MYENVQHAQDMEEYRTHIKQSTFKNCGILMVCIQWIK